MSKNTGGPAFPCDSALLNKGMSLRDYFAAKAMQGFCVPTTEDGPIRNWDFNILAEHAYRCADAMIAERGKSNE